MASHGSNWFKEVPNGCSAEIQGHKDVEEEPLPPSPKSIRDTTSWEAEFFREHKRLPDDKERAAHFIQFHASQPETRLTPGHKLSEHERDLHDAIVMAEMFEDSCIKDGYVIKEGWDLHDLVHGIVVLARAFKGKQIRDKSAEDCQSPSPPPSKPRLRHKDDVNDGRKRILF